VLAYELATAGLKVALLEKARLPRYKTCGGGVTAKAVARLPFDISPILDYKAGGGTLAFAGQTLATADLQEPVAWLVMRDRFDHYLAQQAVAAGAELIEGAAVQRCEQHDGRVSVQTSAGSFTAKVLAGADGVNSVVARDAGLLTGREVGVAIEAEIEVPAKALEEQGSYATFDFGALPHGYGWIFPKPDHLSVGVWQARPGKAPHLPQSLQRYIACNPVLREHRIRSQRGHRIPIGGGRHTLHNGNVLVVGDAANLADPWLGEGIYYAIHSARLAAKAILARFRRGADLSAYTRAIHAGLSREFWHARLIAWFLYKMPELSSKLMGTNPALQQAIFKAIRGDLSLRALDYRLALATPWVLARHFVRSWFH
jgi:geranylgeranyl reductase family protein